VVNITLIKCTLFAFGFVSNVAFRLEERRHDHPYLRRGHLAGDPRKSKKQPEKKNTQLKSKAEEEEQEQEEHGGEG
jgi:hypothetical protein